MVLVAAEMQYYCEEGDRDGDVDEELGGDGDGCERTCVALKQAGGSNDI